MKKSCVVLLAFLFVAQDVAAVVLERDKAKNAEDTKNVKRTEEEKKAVSAQPAGSKGKQYLLPVLDGPIDPDEYILGPSDELILILRGSKTDRVMLRVLPEGTVIVPNLGSFKATGLSLSEFRRKLMDGLKRFYKNVDVNIELSKPRAFMIDVLGEVVNPGPVILEAPFRIIKALVLAGGVNETGSLRRIEVRQKGREPKRVDLFSFMRMGKTVENVILSEGQTIYVPVKSNLVYSAGQLMKPGILEVLPGETLADVIRLSGGFTSTADSMHIVLERFEENSGFTTRVVSMAQCRSIEARNRDGIMVPDIMNFPGNSFVRVIGGGGRTGIFYIFPGEKLRDFLLRVGHFGNEFDLSKAVLERKKANGESEHVVLDLENIIKGDESGNIVLEDKDILNIEPLEEEVYVIGEVQKPGAVPFRSGFNVAKYVSLAGGTTASGDVNKVRIISIDGKTRKAGQESHVFRGETIIVRKKTSKILGSFFVSLASLTGLLISIIAITR